MRPSTCVVWQDDEAWLGYLQEYPEYWTQGESLEDLREHLNDLHADLFSGAVPSLRLEDS
jgi:predicted RNase H-like HicB family nuclease